MPRTKLVKLVYLVDERYFRLYGRTLTGLAYEYDDYGPNAVDNLIVKVGDLLDNHELSINRARALFGGPKFEYQVGPAPRFEPILDESAAEVVDQIIGQYGRLSLTGIIAASKATAPFALSPKPGDRLQMKSLKEEARTNLDALRTKAKARSEAAKWDDDEVGPAEAPGGQIDQAQSRALSK
jgi:hypothetical protein